MFKSCLSFVIAIGFFSFFITSCRTAEKIVYFQPSDSGTDSTSTVSSAGFTPTFKVDDFLSVVITGEDPEAAAVYNLPPTTTVNQGYVSGNPALYGYLVNAKGEISLPVLGTFSVAGKDRMQVEAEIKQKLQDQLKNPTVQIQIQNFKVTVLGDVKTPGTFKIPNERITILEAIGLAGDLRMTGVRNNVLVIRDSNGVKTEYRVDLTSNEVFESPVYYLQQNDVVYVQPNAAARSEGTVWRTTGAIFISLTSLVVTTIALIAR